MLEVKRLTQKTETGPGGVLIEHTGFQPEENAEIIE